MTGYQAPRCATCNHVVGEHKSAGTRWPHPPRHGICLAPGCECQEFRSTTPEPDRKEATTHDTGKWMETRLYAVGRVCACGCGEPAERKAA